jgi:3-oxoacyl-(acyl-carrier-protein) synthase
MNGRATILGCGVVDEHMIAGTSGVSVTWRELGAEPPGTGRTVRAVFGQQDPTFRRIDALAKALVLACEAAGIRSGLDDAERQDTAIVVETDVGALETDLAFAATLGDEQLAAGVFPYSLTSTSLGELALRYGLRGPTFSLSVTPATAGDSVRETLRLFAAGEVRHAVTGCVEALRTGTKEHAPVVRAVVAILAADGDGTELGDDAFATFAARCR